MDIKSALQQLDSLYTEGKLNKAEEHLGFWLNEALETEDYPSALTFFNEMEGLYRTTGRAAEAAHISGQALRLIDFMGLNNTEAHATTLQNSATANRVAGNIDKALEMYIKAAEIYKSIGHTNTYQMASLHHNVSHIYQQKNQHAEALRHLETALNLVSAQPGNEAEIATTNVCMALSHMTLGNMEMAETELKKAMEYYETDEGLKDGHYGSALSALGEFYWHKKDYANAVSNLEKALRFIQNRFGENHNCQMIRRNLESIKKEMNSSEDGR